MSLPDTEHVIREWLRTRVPVTDIAPSPSILFAIPKQDRPPVPCIALLRVGGRPDGYSHDYPLMTFDCWADNKHSAVALAATLADEINKLEYETPFDLPTVGLLKGGQVESGPMQAPGSTWAKRYQVTASFTIQGP